MIIATEDQRLEAARRDYATKLNAIDTLDSHMLDFTARLTENALYAIQVGGFDLMAAQAIRNQAIQLQGNLDSSKSMDTFCRYIIAWQGRIVDELSFHIGPDRSQTSAHKFANEAWIAGLISFRNMLKEVLVMIERYK